MKSSPLTFQVREVRLLTPHTCSLSFEAEEPFSFQAGQYINVRIPNGGKSHNELSRNYSIVTPPEKRPLELCFELVGTGTTHLSRLRPNDTFQARGPYGKFIYEGKSDRHLCYFATGSGIGPFRSIAFSDQFNKASPLSTTCLLGVENEEEILYRDELEKFDSENSRHHFIPVLSHPKSQDWKGMSGSVSDCLKRFGESFPLLKNHDLILDGLEGYPWTRTDFYLCGEGETIAEIKALLLAKGVSQTSIHEEVYFESKETPLKVAA